MESQQAHSKTNRSLVPRHLPSTEGKSHRIEILFHRKYVGPCHDNGGPSNEIRSTSQKPCTFGESNENSTVSKSVVGS